MRLTRVAVIGVALIAVAFATVSVGQSSKVFRVGILEYGSGASGDSGGVIADLRKGLSDIGYVIGRDVDFVYESGNAGQLPERAAALVRSDVNIIVAVRDAAAQAANKATTTIPIVITEYGGDPVRAGLASSLRRPGGNVTGNAMQSDMLWENRLGKLRELVPGAKRLGVPMNRANVGNESCFVAISEVAKAMTIQAIRVEIADTNRVETSISQERLDALAVCGDAATPGFAKAIAEVALKLRLPTVAVSREYVEAGALFSNGANPSDQRREAAYYIDKIRKGAKPGDLAIRQAGVFEIVINVTTAKRIGVVLPPFFLQTIDAKIE
jgi:putative tryptophan/tyrosine transport system substrate-binding protein